MTILHELHTALLESLYEDLDQVLQRSLLKDLVKTLVRSSKRSLPDLVQALLRRSCGDPDEIHYKVQSVHEDLEDSLYQRYLYELCSQEIPV